MFPSRYVLLAGVFVLAALASFATYSAPLVKTEHVEAELVAEHSAAQPGKPLLVGLKLRMEPEWHTYWKNPGDSGLPTRISWSLPPGWQAGIVQWPYPKLLPVGPLMNFGYEDEVVLLSQLTPPASAAPGRAVLKANAEWLVCKDICIPEKGELELALPVSAAQPPASGRWQVAIERAQNMLPVAASGWKSESSIVGQRLLVRLEAPEGLVPPAKATFFPARENLVEPAAPQKVTRAARTLTFELKLVEPVVAGIKSVAGVAVAESGWPGTANRKAIEVEAPVGSLAAALASTHHEGVEASAIVALLFAFVGGLLLNLMPCVFPILGIKVMGFVRHAHGEARAMRTQGAIFALGVLISFIALAALMLALRSAGAQLGWGFQLQSPFVVMMLAALFFVLALNLSGVFEWSAFAQSMTADLTARGRYADAFLSGVLATVVATPCTAPFMGAAVGFTLAQSAGLALAVFAMIGVGMALPVFALSCFPQLLKKLPKPGRWMETFKQVLAFPLYATVAWLAWVLGAQAGNDAVLALLIGLVLIGVGAWLHGRAGTSLSAWRAVLGAIFVVLGLVVAWPGALTRAAPEQAAVARAGELAWEPWSPERVQELTLRGKPVFVDFTAAWCVTCHVNKRLALHNEAVIKAFSSRGVTVLRADWTRQDPRITTALSALGRNAVPVYALYAPGQSAPRLLPELLTPSLVLEELARLPAAPTAVTQR